MSAASETRAMLDEYNAKQEAAARKYTAEMAASDRAAYAEKNKFMADLIEQCRTGVEKLQPTVEQRQPATQLTWEQNYLLQRKAVAQQMTWERNYGLDRAYGVALTGADKGQLVSITYNGVWNQTNNHKQEDIKVNSFFFTVNGMKFTAQEDTPFLTLDRVKEIAGLEAKDTVAMRSKEVTKLVKLTGEDYVFPYDAMAGSATPYVFFTI